MKNWKFYNHAAIPTTQPHEDVDMAPLKDGTIWKMPGKPILARWTSDFDCGYETNWWYVIKDAPIVPEELSSHSRKHIRQGLRKCNIKKISSCSYAEELYECSHAAFTKYENATNECSKGQFIKNCQNNTEFVYWAGFQKESGKLIGYLVVRENKNTAEILTAKFNTDYLNTHISDALYFTVINYCILDKGMKYVSSGQRNINHVTYTQEYKEQTLGYRRAYCKLNIKYRLPVRIVVNVLYPFRIQLKKLDHIGIVHQLLAVMKMEEIVRDYKHE
jgi:hypothetical protein